MAREIYILVNGILTWPGLSKNWNRRGVTAIHLATGGRAHAESLEYLSGVLTRPLLQRSRAAKLDRKVDWYLTQDWKITVAAHSNGADVACDAFRLFQMRGVHRLVLYSPACEPDFERNGLNAALRHGRLGEVEIYRAGEDRALWLADTLPGRALGFGALGRRGPVNVDDAVAHRVSTTVEPEFHHGEWFHPEVFHETIHSLLNKEEAA